METCFLDLLDSLWGGVRANLKLSASGSRHSGTTSPMSILDSIPKVREKEHRRVYGRECVHVGGGESRVKGRESWVISSPYSFFPFEPLAQGGRQYITEYAGPVGKNTHSLIPQVFLSTYCMGGNLLGLGSWCWPEMKPQTPLSEFWTLFHIHIHCIITQHIQVPKKGSISWFE